MTKEKKLELYAKFAGEALQANIIIESMFCIWADGKRWNEETANVLCNEANSLAIEMLKLCEEFEISLNSYNE